MEPNSWLIFVTVGLMLDMGGIIILCGPIIHRFDKKELQLVRKQMSEYKKKYENIEESIKPNNEALSTNYHDYVNGELWKLQYNVLANFNNIFLKEEKDSNTTIWALIIVSTGFFLQIIGNMIKP